MAADKGKAVWPIWILVIVAIVFVVLSFTKEKRPGPAGDVLADKPAASSVQQQDGSIKPAHSRADQAAVAAVKPVEAVVIPLQQVTTVETLAVQVYSFKDQSRADAALKKLKDKGYKAYILVSDLGARGIWYRVRVGPFAKEEEARKTLEAITQEFKSGIIVTE
jgi:cell division septation protein DedD